MAVPEVLSSALWILFWAAFLVLNRWMNPHRRQVGSSRKGLSNEASASECSADDTAGSVVVRHKTGHGSQLEQHRVTLFTLHTLARVPLRTILIPYGTLILFADAWAERERRTIMKNHGDKTVVDLQRVNNAHLRYPPRVKQSLVEFHANSKNWQDMPQRTFMVEPAGVTWMKYEYDTQVRLERYHSHFQNSSHGRQMLEEFRSNNWNIPQREFMSSKWATLPFLPLPILPSTSGLFGSSVIPATTLAAPIPAASIPAASTSGLFGSSATPAAPVPVTAIPAASDTVTPTPAAPAPPPLSSAPRTAATPPTAASTPSSAAPASLTSPATSANAQASITPSAASPTTPATSAHSPASTPLSAASTSQTTPATSTHTPASPPPSTASACRSSTPSNGRKPIRVHRRVSVLSKGPRVHRKLESKLSSATTSDRCAAQANTLPSNAAPASDDTAATAPDSIAAPTSTPNSASMTGPKTAHDSASASSPPIATQISQCTPTIILSTTDVTKEASTDAMDVGSDIVEPACSAIEPAGNAIEPPYDPMEVDSINEQCKPAKPELLKWVRRLKHTREHDVRVGKDGGRSTLLTMTSGIRIDRIASTDANVYGSSSFLQALGTKKDISPSSTTTLLEPPERASGDSRGRASRRNSGTDRSRSRSPQVERTTSRNSVISDDLDHLGFDVEQSLPRQVRRVRSYDTSPSAGGVKRSLPIPQLPVFRRSPNSSRWRSPYSSKRRSTKLSNRRSANLSKYKRGGPRVRIVGSARVKLLEGKRARRDFCVGEIDMLRTAEPRYPLSIPPPNVEDLDNVT
ncbi:hypothetical protein LTR37_005951 [Vermiconidia calcicola]|uniref:Uncharacterized protein n=1 Tax=Vermiconidia calcicola TaxID=1690605 RepID=A0ACC3NJH7_9PEZI|nr:hypothetical protein LTR37_005951 [Vermiconidia calcicola]